MAELTLIAARRPTILERCEANPAWWSGKAWTHREIARAFIEAGVPQMADRHMQLAKQYEMRAVGMTHPSILPSNAIACH
jgi:hypothetical protein